MADIGIPEPESIQTLAAKTNGPAQTTLGKKIGEKPPEVVVLYGPDGAQHKCAPVDAREILESKSGYSLTPPQKVKTGADLFDEAYAQVNAKGAEREQQSEQQSKHGDTAAGETGTGQASGQSNNPGTGQPAGKTSAKPSGNAPKK